LAFLEEEPDSTKWVELACEVFTRGHSGPSHFAAARKACRPWRPSRRDLRWSRQPAADWWLSVRARA